MTELVLKFISISPIRLYRIMKGNFMSKLKQLREEHSMSQKALGDAVGVTATSISRYEIGKRKLSVEMAKKIVRVLGVGRTVIPFPCHRRSFTSAVRIMYQIPSSLAAEGDVIGFRFGRSSGFQWLGVCDYEDVDFHEEYENKEETAEKVLLELLAEDMGSRRWTVKKEWPDM